MPCLSISERAPGVVQVTMSRPEVFNAFDESMVYELKATFALLGEEPGVRAIVLAGSGRHFSAGADLQWMRRASVATPEWNLADARRFAAMLAEISECPKPTVARVQGAALGGGVGLACACDLAIATEDATFAVSEARFGILPAVIGPYLVNAAGRRQAQRLALSCARIDAQEAMAIGLVHRISAPAALDEAVDAGLKEFLAAGPKAQLEIKQLFAQLTPSRVTAEVKELTAQTISRVRRTPEAQEGLTAFLEKRPPSWVRAE